jgi:hypothetical protein
MRMSTGSRSRFVIRMSANLNVTYEVPYRNAISSKRHPAKPWGGRWWKITRIITKSRNEKKNDPTTCSAKESRYCRCARIRELATLR